MSMFRGTAEAPSARPWSLACPVGWRSGWSSTVSREARTRRTAVGHPLLEARASYSARTGFRQCGRYSNQGNCKYLRNPPGEPLLFGWQLASHEQANLADWVLPSFRNFEVSENSISGDGACQRITPQAARWERLAAEDGIPQARADLAISTNQGK